LKAIFFITTNGIGTEGYLNPGHIQEMNEAGCCDFGSHSVSHKNLFTLEDDKLVEELVDLEKSHFQLHRAKFISYG
jgi:peptidoglycan/xylan/chitin deacetylase (PgdA/CDA1 family)